MQVVVIMCLKHIPLYKDIPTVAHECFACVLDLSQEGPRYVTTRGAGIGNVVLWNVGWHLMLLYNDSETREKTSSANCVMYVQEVRRLQVLNSHAWAAARGFVAAVSDEMMLHSVVDTYVDQQCPASMVLVLHRHHADILAADASGMWSQRACCCMYLFINCAGRFGIRPLGVKRTRVPSFTFAKKPMINGFSSCT